MPRAGSTYCLSECQHCVGLAGSHARPLTQPFPTPRPQVLVIAGGITVGHKVKGVVLAAQKQQKQLCAEVLQGRTNVRKAPKIQVNKLFFKRLLAILSM